MNGGTCQAAANGGYVCTCPNCYSGTNCQTCIIFNYFLINKNEFKFETYFETYFENKLIHAVIIHVWMVEPVKLLLMVDMFAHVQIVIRELIVKHVFNLTLFFFINYFIDIKFLI